MKQFNALTCLQVFVERPVPSIQLHAWFYIRLLLAEALQLFRPATRLCRRAPLTKSSFLCQCVSRMCISLSVSIYCARMCALCARIERKGLETSTQVACGVEIIMVTVLSHMHMLRGTFMYLALYYTFMRSKPRRHPNRLRPNRMNRSVGLRSTAAFRYHLHICSARSFLWSQSRTCI